MQEVQEEMSDSLKVTDSDVDKPPAKEEMINSLKVTDSDVDKPLAKEEMINSLKVTDSDVDKPPDDDRGKRHCYLNSTINLPNAVQLM